MSGGCTRLYEQESLRKVTGDTIGPGGANLTERAIASCYLSRGAKILDVGCGTGTSVQAFREKNGFRVVGVDASELMLQVGLQRCPDLPLVRGKSLHLPFVDDQMEAIFVECSLSLMSDIDSVLQEFYRVLRPAGYLIASDLYPREPQAIDLLRSLTAECCLKRAKSRPELYAILQQQGFEIMVWEDHSEDLRYLITQLIQANGSMQGFWCNSGSGENDLFEMQYALARAKPGYYLLVARKIDTA